MSYHSPISGFQSALGELRKIKPDAVEAVPRISLPFSVQSEIVSKNNLSLREGGTKMLYVDKKATVIEECGVVADMDAFMEV